MKKVLIAAALIGAVGLVGTQIASARNGFGGGCGPGTGGGCGGNGPGGWSETVEQDDPALAKFLDETADIRRDLVVKRSALSAMMRQDNPDETKVATLTGELYDLRGQLETMAEEAGLEKYARGPGMMGNGRGCNGPMGW